MQGPTSSYRKGLKTQALALVLAFSRFYKIKIQKDFLFYRICVSYFYHVDS